MGKFTLSVPWMFVAALVGLAVAFILYKWRPSWAKPVLPYLDAIMVGLAALAIWKHPTIEDTELEPDDQADDSTRATQTPRRSTPDYGNQDEQQALEDARQEARGDVSGLSYDERLERLRQRRRSGDKRRDKLEQLEQDD